MLFPATLDLGSDPHIWKSTKTSQRADRREGNKGWKQLTGKKNILFLIFLFFFVNLAKFNTV